MGRPRKKKVTPGQYVGQHIDAQQAPLAKSPSSREAQSQAASTSQVGADATVAAESAVATDRELQAASRCSARAQLTALTCVTLASACSFSSLSPSRPLLSPSARAVQAASRCSARAQLTALRACCSPPPAASALSLHPGRCSRPRPERRRPHRAARCALSSPPSRACCSPPPAASALSLSLHSPRCSRPQLERCRPHRAARRALSSPPSRALRSPPPAASSLSLHLRRRSRPQVAHVASVLQSKAGKPNPRLKVTATPAAGGVSETLRKVRVALIDVGSWDGSGMGHGLHLGK